MGEAGTEFFLLTFHGTLLCHDRQRVVLCHQPLPEAAGRFLPLRLAPGGGGLKAVLSTEDATVREGLLAVLAGVAFGAGLHASSLNIQRRGLFASAERNGNVGFNNQCMGWESFLPLTDAVLARLRDVLASSWRLPGVAETIGPAAIRLGANFSLRFGDLDVDLARTVPGWAGGEAGAADRIGLMPRRGDVIVAERQRPRHAVPAPKIWIQPLGNTANRALQYLTAEAMRGELPEAVIENVHLPEWGRVTPQPRPIGAAATGPDRYRIDVPGLADCLRRRVVPAVIIDGFTYNLDQYPPRQIAKRLLGETVTGGEARGFGAGELVCSVRGGEILRGAHGDYLPLPAGYYRLLAERSGLDLIFFGQLGDDTYTRGLRAAFPRARFVAGRDPGYDFDTLRRSVNIALAISTFGWLAAWLSEAETIYLPVGGMFNPVQHPDQHYLPVDDPVYRFVLLPYAKMFDSEAEPARFERQQAMLAAGARMIAPAEVIEIAGRAAPLGKGRVHVGGFDPAYYASRYPDVAEWVSQGRPALEHYLRAGALEGRQPLTFEPNFYVERYPEAAMEIALGLYPTPLAHYLAAGWRRGYAPTASAM